MFRRITAAATKLLKAEGPEGAFYTLEGLNSAAQSLIPTHPALVLLWCQILLIINYTNYAWWSEVHHTPRYAGGGLGTRRSAWGGGAPTANVVMPCLLTGGTVCPVLSC